MEAFTDPDWRAPLDLEARLDALPPDGWVKGMFLDSIVQVVARRRGVRPGRGWYAAFRNYPLRNLLELLVDASRLLYPDRPTRDGLRRLGWLAYPTFARSHLGKVLLALSGDNAMDLLHLAPRAYDLIGNAGSARVVQVGPTRAILELRAVWGWPDAYNVGIHEGALAELRCSGRVRVRVHSLCDADLELAW